MILPSLSPRDLLRPFLSSSAVVLVLFGPLADPDGALQPSASLLVANADVGWDSSTNRLQPCPYESNCVSSSYLEPPNRYISPLKTLKDQDAAFAGALRDLTSSSSGATTQITVVEASPKSHYIHLTVPGTSPGSLDDIELLFGEEAGIVNWRCQARVKLPPPPFCLQKNCINGNMDQRRRMDGIGQILGMPKADQERMGQSAKWTPIFFNSDQVPGFYDEEDY